VLSSPSASCVREKNK